MAESVSQNQKVGAGGMAAMGQNRGMTSKSVPKIVPMFQTGNRTTKQRRGLRRFASFCIVSARQAPVLCVAMVRAIIPHQLVIRAFYNS
jgi:hypothetical protein